MYLREWRVVVLGFVFWVPGFVFWVPGLVFWELGFVFWVSGFVFWMSGFVFWGSGFVFWVRGFVLWVRGLVFWVLGLVLCPMEFGDLAVLYSNIVLQYSLYIRPLRQTAPKHISSKHAALEKIERNLRLHTPDPSFAIFGRASGQIFEKI